MIGGKKIEQPQLAKHDSSVLDLAFVMDCTGSMGSYIENAREVLSEFLFFLFRFWLKPKIILSYAEFEVK